MSADNKDSKAKVNPEEEKTDEVYDEEVPQDFTLRLAEIRHLLSLPKDLVSADETKSLREEALNIVKTNDMSFHYQSIFGKDVDADLLKTMQDNNTKKMDEFTKEMETAEASGGESDIQDINIRKARYLALIGSKDEAVTLLKQCLAKAVGGGSRIDVSMSIIRVALAHDDIPLFSDFMTSTHSIIEKEGDWERRNRFGVYRGVLALIERRFKDGADLFVSAVPTFTCTELVNYDTVIMFAVLTAIAHLERTKLKEKVIDCPDVIQALNEMPKLNSFLSSLYQCKYSQLFSDMIDIAGIMQRNRFLAPHVEFYLKQVRIVAYTQFITSYKSITIQSMAKLFGVSPSFIDKELANLISNGKIQCKIDAVNGTIIRNSDDNKNSNYSKLLQTGDILLNKTNKIAQKLKTA